MSRIVVVGNPENRRVHLFSEAAKGRGFAVHLISWRDVVRGAIDLRNHIESGDLVRIESPGENPDVEYQFISHGARMAGLRRVPWIGEFGAIEDSALWYEGFCGTLQTLRDCVESVPSIQWMNHPDDIVTMFDKSTCQSKLFASGSIPVPPILGKVNSYIELRALMAQHGMSRVFLKLPYSSSASGVIAFEANKHRITAQTSVEVVYQKDEIRLFNSLRLRKYRDEAEIAGLIDKLGSMGLHVEQWIPKAGFDGRTFDVRAVVIAGRVRHVVVRTSTSPMTNLHLGNQRGNVDRLRQLIPDTTWDAAMETCERVAACFPKSLYAGIDLMFAPGYRRHFVLEVNAFGDLLPNVLCDGLSTYEAELHAVESKAAAKTMSLLS